MKDNKKYQEGLMKGFKLLDKENAIFLGQNILHAGCPMFNAMKEVDRNKMIEMPIIEDTQMGMATGLALEGFVPISIFPRMDFLICATNQLVNHLDKVEQMSQGEFKTGVIIITQLGNTKPLNPGPQHCGDYTEGLKSMLKNIHVKTVNNPQIDFKCALRYAKKGKSTLLICKATGPWVA